MAFKVGKKDWKLSLGDGQCPPSRSAATLKLSVAPRAGNNDFELLLDIAKLLSKRAVFVRYETHSTQV
ncbi:hypothetical protein J8I87_38855 [Paraburkholderia sp. LEh10]|uniref:hypothetical protein n=1 Tax=Paraburkholderia sp. LEh10 TaxID=2821353 RepID=UPI001AE1D3DF|nr:hypothetical protein [Paraburkholderia sp. LEh10]MBP0595502.1 hypothetical protein [Paraburkholderia sp. LEh10]